MLASVLHFCSGKPLQNLSSVDTGKKAKEITASLGKPDDRPSVEEAKAHFAKDTRETFRRHVAEAQEQKLCAMEPLEERRKGIVREHREERARLERMQSERWNAEIRARAARLHSGFKEIWQRLSGEHARIQKQNEWEAYASLKRDREQRDGLIFAQLEQRRVLQQRINEVRQQHVTLMRDLRQERQRS